AIRATPRPRATSASTTSDTATATAAMTAAAQDCSIPRRTMTVIATTWTWTWTRTISAATTTAITPEPVYWRMIFSENPFTLFRPIPKAKRPPFPGGRFCFEESLEHDDPGADIDPAIEIDDVLVAHSDAARGDVGADGPGLVGAVN